MWIQQNTAPTYIPARELNYDTHGRSGSTIVYSNSSRVIPGDRVSVTPEIGPRSTTRVSNTVWTPVKTQTGQLLGSEYSSERREGSKSQTAITIHTQRAESNTPRHIPYTGSVSIVPVEVAKPLTIYQGSVTTPRRSQTYIATHQTLIDRTPRSPQGGSPSAVYVHNQQYHTSPTPIQQVTSDQMRMTTSRVINPNETAIRSARDTNTRLKEQLKQVRVDRDRVMRSNEGLMQKLQELSEKLHLKVLKRIQARTNQPAAPTPTTTAGPVTTSARGELAVNHHQRTTQTPSRGYISLMGTQSHSRGVTRPATQAKY